MTQVQIAIPRRTSVERISTGDPVLDSALDGGIPRRSVILVSGSPGTGKTTFGATFVHNGATQHNENGIYVSFGENKASFFRNMETLGFDFESLQNSQKFEFLELPTVERNTMNGFSGEIVRAISSTKAKRLVIDSFSVIAQAQDNSYESRKIFQTTLKNIVTAMGCTVVVIGEQLGDHMPEPGIEEFVADGVIHLKHTRPRELEILKMSGTKVRRADFIFTIDRGFRCMETKIEDVGSPSRWKPIPDTGNRLSSGSPQLDEILGGGFPRGAFVVIQADTDVTIKETRLLTLGIAMNFISQKRGALLIPQAGAAAEQVEGMVKRYVGRELFNKFVKIAEELKVEELRSETVTLPPHVVLLKGGRNNVDVDAFALYSVLTELKRISGNQPAYRDIGYDTLESKYADDPSKMFNEVGFAIMRTRAAGDLTVGIAKPSMEIINKVLDMVDWHFKMWKKDGVLLFQGIKPETNLYAVTSDNSKGYPQMVLTELN
jgi:KaiC/GvpD/RAD55 family RecA-like ATPase